MHDIDRICNFEAEAEMQPVQYRPRAQRFPQREAELASQLMEVNNEAEFENFLGDLISSAAKTVGGFLDGPTGRALGGLLKGAARQILPLVSQAAGEGEVGEAELEALEWEAATNFVRLAQEASVQAAQTPPGGDPNQKAQDAVVTAAQTTGQDHVLVQPSAPLSPGMAQPALPPHLHHHGHAHQHSGRWMRRGNQIILFGV
ncbi:MAG TPA: hypothetical protein VKB88_27030 [Bryobacteraceae bacterium]|nr:hypothetical protein [Bryobacteraceae bacterium]